MYKKFVYILCASAMVGIIIVLSVYYVNNKQKSSFSTFLQYLNSGVKTIQTPEETHSKLLKNLKDGNFKKATECCFFTDEFQNRKEFFENVQQRKMLEIMIGDLSVIKKENITDSTASYSYLSDNNKTGNLIIFVKDEHGVWRIKSL